MANMISINIDEDEVRKICHERIGQLVNEVESEYVYWDSNELSKRTCMSWNTIQSNFFNDPRFIKSKIGGKWYFPVPETKDFLKKWISERRTL